MLPNVCKSVFLTSLKQRSGAVEYYGCSNCLFSALMTKNYIIYQVVVTNFGEKSVCLLHLQQSLCLVAFPWPSHFSPLHLPLCRSYNKSINTYNLVLFKAGLISLLGVSEMAPND